MRTPVSQSFSGPYRRALRRTILCIAVALVAVGCGDDTENSVGTAGPSGCFDDPGIDPIEAPASADGTGDEEDQSGRSITLLTHESFLLSPGTLESFTAETGIEVELVQGGDAGALVAEAVLTKDNPTADVLFGIDNSFLCRGLEEGLFVPYASPALDGVADELELDPHNRLTPISYGDVCVNYWTDELPGDPPESIDELTEPDYAGQFVTPNPETSSPGFAFLLATIATYGDDGWEAYWEALVDNDVAVTAGWSDAYYGDFIAGGGDRSLVTSYASSPPAEVVFSETPIDTPPTGVIADSCFRQIEFAGILAGSDDPDAAARLIDFMLRPTYQADVPLNMFVYPAVESTELPEVFEQFGTLTDDPVTLDPVAIEENRDEWTQRWTEIVLG